MNAPADRPEKSARRAVGVPDPLSIDTNTMLPGASKVGGSFRSPIQAFMMSIQIGSAASAPVWLCPMGFFWSRPTHTPSVMSGSKPMNQASV